MSRADGGLAHQSRRAANNPSVAVRLEENAQERAVVEREIADLGAQLDEWDVEPPADAALDWWNSFSAAVRGEVVDAESVRDANAALRERFAGIYVTCGNTPHTGRASFTTRFDFILKDETADAPTKPFWLHFTGDGAELRGTPPSFDQTGQLTFVAFQREG
jgi:hypothetical protein